MDAMSDTPKTDAESYWSDEFQEYVVLETFSKKLERELNDLRHENGNLRQHIELLKASK